MRTVKSFAGPSMGPSASRATTPVARRICVACSGRSWSASRCSSARAPCRPRALRRPSHRPIPLTKPRSQIDQRRARARRAVDSAHAAQHARRGRECAQPERALQCRFACVTNSPHSPAPRCGRICRARRDAGAFTSALQRCAPRRRARRASVGKSPGTAVLGAARCARRACRERAVE